jgi:disulfide bond formation protein DsbB
MDGVYLMSLLTLFSNIFLIVLLVAWILSSQFKNERLWKLIIPALKKNALPLAFIISLTAMLGSLYFSEVRGFAPCLLCWYQRVFMYPLPFIFGVALYKKTRDVVYYAMPLAVIGGLIAAYHYYLQVNPNPLAPCAAIGFAVSCSDRFTTNFGYITIPWMSLSAFVLITVLLVIFGKAKILK